MPRRPGSRRFTMCGRKVMELAHNPPQMPGQGKRTDLDEGLDRQSTKLGRSSDYRVARIARDHPDILDRMKAEQKIP